ncbi:hypothetical protein MWU38_13925 [Qipengyuania sp. S6317L1]|nr:hypothetical protein [Qipengyuania sp. S6317L1]
MKVVSGVVSSVAFIALSACGGGGGSPAPTPTPTPVATASPTPTPTPAPSPIPPRSSMAEYEFAFMPSEDRGFGGFRLAVTNRLTGATLPDGNPEISSSVGLEEDDGPRSSDGIGFSGYFGYEAATGSSRYLDKANNSNVFDASGAFLVSQPSFLRWILPMGAFSPDPESLTWSMANAFGQKTPEFYSVVMLDRPSDTLVRNTWTILGGSPTVEEDLPPSGVEQQTARLLLESDEPGDGSYLLVAEGPLTINYDDGKITGTFSLQPGTDSLAKPITVEIDADFNLSPVSFSTPPGQILGDITGVEGAGRIGGAFFGPYGREIAISVQFETSSGQSFYGDLEARRD